MKIIALSMAILVFSLSACAQKAAESNTATKVEPNISAKLDTTLPWLQVKIWDYQNKPVSNPPRRIIKTTFEGKPVYYVPAICCDIPSQLYAEDGALMCYPSGGFTGAGDGKCPKFKLEYLDNKTDIVWEDKRKPAASSTPGRVVPNLQ
jgi:hypothetical protein